MSEQRNRYKGYPLRAWLRLSFRDRDGATVTVELLADTGTPQALILGPELFDRLVTTHTSEIGTNYGSMQGGWVRLYSPELGLVEFVEAYRSEGAAQAAARSHKDFVGLVGLSLLRLLEYGGNTIDFWIRTPTTPTTSTP